MSDNRDGDNAEELSWAERVGLHVESEAQEWEGDSRADVLRDAAWRLDDALAEDDFMVVEDDVDAVLYEARSMCDDDDLIGLAVAVRLRDFRPAGGSETPRVPGLDLYVWQPLLEDLHGWEDDQNQDVVRAQHDKGQSADAIRHYVSAIQDRHQRAWSAAVSGETRSVLAEIGAMAGLAAHLDDAHHRWWGEVSELLEKNPQLAGPAADFYATAFAHSLAATEATGESASRAEEEVDVDDGGLFPPPGTLL